MYNPYVPLYVFLNALISTCGVIAIIFLLISSDDDYNIDSDPIIYSITLLVISILFIYEPIYKKKIIVLMLAITQIVISVLLFIKFTINIKNDNQIAQISSYIFNSLSFFVGILLFLWKSRLGNKILFI